MQKKKSRTKKGYARGQDHCKAYIPDSDVLLMRELYETTNITMAEVARKFEYKYFTVVSILTYKSRYAVEGL